MYAAAGSHESGAQALAGLHDGIYAAFNEKLLDLLAANMALQSRAGADCVALFDTAAGEIDAATYGKFVVPGARRPAGAVSQAGCDHAGDVLLARHRARILGPAVRICPSSAWAWTGGTP